MQQANVSDLLEDHCNGKIDASYYPLTKQFLTNYIIVLQTFEGITMIINKTLSSIG